MKYLIAGLGNPGAEYQGTRHNIGFEVLDALAGASNISFRAERHADVATLKHKGKTLFLIKPSTYMNLSGKALRYWVDKEKIPLENVLVITDDLALPFGTLRMRGKGSDGGHNGLKSIQELLQSTNYARLRFGIGNEFAKGSQVNYVLGKWDDSESAKIKERIQRSCEMTLSFCTAGLANTMSQYNNT